MFSSERRRPTIRLTPEQDKRLERAAQRDGKTKQAFALEAILQKVETSDAARGGKGRGERDARPASPAGLQLDFGQEVGLEVERRVADASPASVDGVALLVAYVSGGSTDGERRRRLAAAADALRAAPETRSHAAEFTASVRAAAGLDTVVDKLTRILQQGGG